MTQEVFDTFGKRLTEWAIVPTLEHESQRVVARSPQDRPCYSKLSSLSGEQISAVEDIVQDAIIVAITRTLMTIRDLGEENGEGVFLVDRRKGREDIDVSYSGEVDLYAGMYGPDGWLCRFGPEKYRDMLVEDVSQTDATR